MKYEFVLFYVLMAGICSAAWYSSGYFLFVRNRLRKQKKKTKQEQNYDTIKNIIIPKKFYNLHRKKNIRKIKTLVLANNNNNNDKKNNITKNQDKKMGCYKRWKHKKRVIIIKLLKNYKNKDMTKKQKY